MAVDLTAALSVIVRQNAFKTKKTKAGSCVALTDNRGFPVGCNQGIKIARGAQVLLLNNDTVVTTGWLQ